MLGISLGMRIRLWLWCLLTEKQSAEVRSGCVFFHIFVHFCVLCIFVQFSIYIFMPRHIFHNVSSMANGNSSAHSKDYWLFSYGTVCNSTHFCTTVKRYLFNNYKPNQIGVGERKLYNSEIIFRIQISTKTINKLFITSQTKKNMQSLLNNVQYLIVTSRFLSTGVFAKFSDLLA